jgi:ABC-type transport system substrate-binding protein
MKSSVGEAGSTEGAMMFGHRQEIRFVVALAVFALMTAACMSGADPTTTTTQQPTATDDQEPASQETSSTTTPKAPSPDGFIYKTGMTVDLTDDNMWRWDGGIFDWYVLGLTKPALFRVMYPGVVVAPDVASGLPAEPVEADGVWTITQRLRDDYTWSDGSLLTAHDIVFTFETVRDLDLSLWTAYPYGEDAKPRLLNTEAIDDFTVKYTFDSKPGAAVWPHKTGYAWIMPKTAWEPVVAEAKQTEDPAAFLFAVRGLDVGDLSGGPVVYRGREPGAFLENVANEYYANDGMVHTFWSDGSYAQNGELLYGTGTGEVTVEYTEGPYMDQTIFSIYTDQTTAMMALINGEIDFWLNPVGMSPGLLNQGLEADHLTPVINAGNGMRYLAFNLRKSPGSYQEFRQALAYMVDKEFLTQNVLQGNAYPMYVMVPQGNQAWYNTEVAEAVASRYVGLSAEERLSKAMEVLRSAGFTWEVEPAFDSTSGEIVPGRGIIDPAGVKVPELEILAPPASYDPMRATASLWIEGWLEQLGVPAKANPTGFNTIIADVWPGVGEDVTFDMYILGWSLGDPNWPTYHESFFHSRHLAEVDDGNNSTGYSDPDFDELADAMMTINDQAEAFNMVWQMEEMLAEDLPYIVLFDSALTEFYNDSLHYPFTSTLSGIQYLAGMPATVTKY